MSYELYRSALTGSALTGIILLTAAAGASAQDTVIELAELVELVERPALEPGPQAKVNHVVLTVRRAGAHLDEGQRVSIIGPINPAGDYLLIPLPVDEGAETRWIPAPYLAWRSPMNGSSGEQGNAERSAVYDLPDVRVRDTREHQSATLHSAVSMRILADGSDGPESVVIFTPPHEGSLGQHGGIAHLTSN